MRCHDVVSNKNCKFVECTDPMEHFLVLACNKTADGKYFVAMRNALDVVLDVFCELIYRVSFHWNYLGKLIEF